MSESSPLRGRDGESALIGRLLSAAARGEAMTAVLVDDTLETERSACQLTALVGRDGDLGTIRAFIDQVSVGGAALLMTGDPGVGKSALLDVAHEMRSATP